LWDLSLVDPDNRRPVDYERRIGLLDCTPRPMRELLEHWQDGRVKLELMRRILQFRAAHSGLFEHGDYRALTVARARCDRICAFERHHEGETAVVAAALFPARREADPDWAGTTIALHTPMSPLRDILT